MTRPRQIRLPSERVVHLSDEVVDAVKRGDRRAWEAAYDTYGKGLMGFLVLRLGDRDDAAEALSETFLRALEKIDGLRGGADAFRAWLFRIARNVATDRLRSRARLTLEAEPDESVDRLTGGPVEQVIAAEDAVEVRRALASLSADDREVVWLRVCAGLSSDEVGEIVGKKAGTVRMQQLRALEAMARQLTP
ncbi:MAG TPA: RNA polymerase sigma factor [Acidimicrobiales bacterium]|nr:RNA polymerase sigma factor [Acidimicrobiales bacterium]